MQVLPVISGVPDELELLELDEEELEDEEVEDEVVEPEVEPEDEELEEGAITQLPSLQLVQDTISAL